MQLPKNLEIHVHVRKCFQEVSKVDDKNDDEKIKLICDPKKESHGERPGGIFLGEWKLCLGSVFWELLAWMASAVKIEFVTLLLWSLINRVILHIK